MPEGKTVLVSGTPAGVLGGVMTVAFRWSPLRYDHRLQDWQAFGLLYGLDTSHLVLAR